MSKKRFVFKTDRKLFWLIIITLILFIAKNLVDIKTLENFMDNILFCLLILATIIALNLISKIKFYIEQGYLYREGVFSGSTVKLKNIRRIYLSGQNTIIEHQDNSKTSKLVIKNHLLETDTLKAQEFLKYIVDNADENMNVDNKISKFIEGNTEALNDYDYSKFSGSILILSIALIIFACLDLVGFLSYFLLIFLKYDVLFASTGLLLLLNASWGIAAIIMLFRKMKKAIKAIKIFRIYIILSAFTSSVLTYLMQKNIEAVTTDISILRLVVEVIIEVLISILFFRYLNTSTRIKKTLIN